MDLKSTSAKASRDRLNEMNKSVDSKRIILVLGMHRSGTSAITRGLLTLGADPGNDLMPGVAGDNAMGFWEDREFNTINIALLHQLGHDWHTLTPIKEEELRSPALASLRLRAIDFLRNRTQRHAVFALKDPRASRLLPFWQDLLAHLKIDTSYVIALRHPISVAQSLNRRNGIASEKSYQLWIEHTIDSLHYSSGYRRVVLDYDRLLDNPAHELSRIGKTLDLPAAADFSEKIREFAESFLDQALRHSRFDAHDLALDAAANTLLIDLFSQLQRAATDEISLDDASLTGLIKCGRDFLRDNYPLLNFSHRTEMQLYGVRSSEASLSEQLRSAQSLAAETENQRADLQQHIHDLEQALHDLSHTRDHLSELATEKQKALDIANTALVERSAFIAKLQQELLTLTLAFKQAQQQDLGARGILEKTIDERRSAISSLESTIDRHLARINQLEENLANAQSLYHQEMERHQQAETALQREHEKIIGIESAIASYVQQTRELERRLGELNQQLEQANQVIADQANHINVTNCERDLEAAALNEAREQLQQLELQIVATEQIRLKLERALIETRASHSWRITAPARALANIVRELRRKIHRFIASTARRIYRGLPLSVNQKQRLKGLVFSSLGFFLRGSYSYQNWKRNQETRNLEALVEKSLAPQNASLNAHLSLANTPYTGELQPADGVAEWRDYASIRARINAILQHARNNQQLATYPLIDMGDKSPFVFAKDIDIPKASNPLVSIILPVYNNLKLTLECLLSISRHTDASVAYEIIVADDASTDDTAAVLKGIPNLRITSNAKNLGFLRNCNEAAKLVRGRYILFLNNDVQVTEGWLSALLAAFAQEGNIGAVGPKIVYPSGHLQEAGVAYRHDGTTHMIGLGDSPSLPEYNYRRDVDYCSGACLLMETALFNKIGGFDDRFAPAYCEDADLCLQIHAHGLRVVYCPDSVIVHHLSKTSDVLGREFKLQCIATNIAKLTEKWQETLDQRDRVRVLAFYLPQFHPIPENDLWWGKGFTEWSNVTKAQPNFIGHYQPRQPADLGFYDLRIKDVMQQQAALAKRYGIDGFCFYYYWFNGKRLLEQPLEHLLGDDAVDMPFCLCWANENWSRRWDGRDTDLLMAQQHSDADDLAVIHDLMRYFASKNYIRVNGKPLILVYRVTLFPDFRQTVARWRKACAAAGIGEIYVTMVESFELVHKGIPPAEYGCDAAVEFPPQELAEIKTPSGKVINPQFDGMVADYRDLAVRYATRAHPGYRRFHSASPGWDNTARRQNNSFCFENASPGAFQAWLETAIDKTKAEFSGDERLIFINAWNEWAEGAYLEPDRRFGHTFLEAVKNARDSQLFKRTDNYMLDN